MATAGADSVGPDTGPGSTIATVETDTGRLVERRPLAYLVVWGARNERRTVVLERPRADELAAAHHGQVVALVAAGA